MGCIERLSTSSWKAAHMLEILNLIHQNISMGSPILHLEKPGLGAEMEGSAMRMCSTRCDKGNFSLFSTKKKGEERRGGHMERVK